MNNHETIIEIPSESDDFYQQMRIKMRNWVNSSEGAKHKWAELLMMAPDLFHLMLKLARDKELPTRQKMPLIVAIVYFITPLDFIPEMFSGPIGFVDDIALAAFVLKRLINDTNLHKIEGYWAGEKNLLESIQRIIQAADSMLGSGMVRRLKKLI